MNGSRKGSGYEYGEFPVGESSPSSKGSAYVFGGIWGLLLVCTLLVAGPWAGFHALLLGGVGLLMLIFPPTVSLPRLWWILALLFIVLGAAPFLPAGWFSMPGWRGKLEALGVDTGKLVVIQSSQAAEAFALFGITLLTGLWLAGHRPSSSQRRLWALAFTVGVAVYALVARISQDSVADGQFGFFPNRNHTATYLAMGTLCGLGNLLQALRDRRFVTMAISLAATGVCLWAVAAWSVSRGGVALVVIGSLIWIPMLGRQYLGQHGLRALCLIGLAGAGLFFIADSGVKERITSTMSKAGGVIGSDTNPPPGAEKPAVATTRDLDFRIPTALDTLSLIRDFKWTGIGAGQFSAVFPQYRNLTAVVNDSDNLHPESDWLWLAAETGIPATLAMAVLVGLAFRKSLVSILGGRNRAVRSACLVAAMLVPIHGLFDVPGHRISLALSAAFLFALSLRAPSGEASPVSRTWLFRLASLALLVTGGFLARAQWGGGAQPALLVAKTSMAEARWLYQSDQALSGQYADPDFQPTGEDPLKWALELLEKAGKSAPLDREILRYRGFLALHFAERADEVRKVFRIERELDPTWVESPLRQALAWSVADPEETSKMWQEALRRARWLDQHHPGTQWSEARTRERIRQQGQASPILEEIHKSRFGG